MLSNFSFSDSTVGFLIEGKFDNETVEKLISEIEEKLKIYDKINLYVEDVGIETFHIPALIKEIHFKIKHKNRFHKVALVSSRKWISACGNISSLFTDSITQNFTSEERLKAMTWIAAR